VLFKNSRASSRVLECWSVAEDRLCWTHKSQFLDDLRVVEFAAEVIDGGQAAVILVCGRVIRLKCVPTFSLYHSPFTCLRYFYSYMEIIYLDFSSGTSHPLLLTRAPDTNFADAFCHPHICGELAIVSIPYTRQIFLVNWKTESCVILSPSTVRHLPSVVFETHEFTPAIFRRYIYSRIYPRGFTGQ
jgi:hypothetical protein